MYQKLFIIVTIIPFCGCTLFCTQTLQKSSLGNMGLHQLKFERTLDKTEQKKQEEQKVTVRFSEIPFSQAMQLLTEETGRAIVWSPELDNNSVTGIFMDETLPTILNVLGRRHNVAVSQMQNIYYLGQYRKDDRVTAVLRVPSVDVKTLQESVKSVLSEYGSVSILGSVVWISDSLEVINRVVSDIELIREKLERSYIAEVYFVRVSDEDFANLAANLRVNAIDVFATNFNIEQLFSLFIEAEANMSNVGVDSRPVLNLSEGRESSIEVGNEIVAERKAVNADGIMQTVGFDKFQDGLKLVLKLQRVSEDKYSVDLSLNVSTFDQGSSELIPKKSLSVLQSPGLLCKDGVINFAGSLNRNMNQRVYKLFGLEGREQKYILTIWIRVREVR